MQRYFIKNKDMLLRRIRYKTYQKSNANEYK